jgi:tetratricopeptide (TPR) repeat protein
MTQVRRSAAVPSALWLVLLLCLLGSLRAALAAEPRKVGVTTSSAEARALFLRGRALVELLRGTDAHPLFAQAVAKDPGFALGWLFLANTANTAAEFFPALEKAAALADKASEGEQLFIRAAQAGARSDPAGQEAALERLVALFPEDERAQTALGLFYGGTQEWSRSITHLKAAMALAPDYSPPLNQLGYDYRFQGDLASAEDVFKRAVALQPKEPNPLDSYAELLMKQGRFEESIATYRKALVLDPHFVASYVGIAQDQVLLGRGEEARKTLRKLQRSVARNSGERRTALFWAAISFVHEGRYPEAAQAAREEEAIAKADQNLLAQSQDEAFLGTLALEAGDFDQAQARFAESAALNQRASVPDAAKEAQARALVFNQARLALARRDLSAAAARTAEYRALAAQKKVPFELWQAHELAGWVLLEKQEFVGARAELAQANQQDPRVLYLTALALAGEGEVAAARAMAGRAADYNEVTNPNFAYVRSAAKKLAAARAG